MIVSPLIVPYHCHRVGGSCAAIATTKLEGLPERPQTDKILSYILVGLMIMSIIILLLVQSYVPLNLWEKMAITLASITILFLTTRFVYRVYVRIQSRQIPRAENSEDTT